MKNLSKRDYSILIGSAVDHFDTAIYSFLAPVFAQLFFPNSNPIISLILAYSVLATTIITRPLGSYIFCLIALNDRYQTLNKINS
jgi:MFS family permease